MTETLEAPYHTRYRWRANGARVSPERGTPVPLRVWSAAQDLMPGNRSRKGAAVAAIPRP